MLQNVQRQRAARRLARRPGRRRHQRSAGGNGDSEGQAQRAQGLERRGAMPLEHPPRRLFDQRRSAAESRHGDPRHQAFVPRKPLHADRDRHEISQASPGSGHRADAQGDDAEMAAAKTGHRPAAAEQQPSRHGAAARTDAIDESACQRGDSRKDDVENGKGQLDNALAQPIGFLQRPDEHRPGIGGAQANLHRHGGAQNGIAFHPRRFLRFAITEWGNDGAC
ncbi:MAG: hypothetical protein BWZ10_02072 [candidate division BRC1 bacterium ADurb.BinA364]|nr:MAG: hypothetical protein BWZ10_02072 [candidate division BRC1 bacterium ADurb.BinA364]